MLRPGTGGGFQQFRGGRMQPRFRPMERSHCHRWTGQLSTQCRRTSRNAYVRTARLGSTDVLNEGLHIDRQPNGLLRYSLIGTGCGYGPMERL